MTDSAPSLDQLGLPLSKSEEAVIYLLVTFCFLPLMFILHLLCPGRLISADQRDRGGGEWVLSPFSLLAHVPCFRQYRHLSTTKAPFGGPTSSVVLAPTKLLTLRETPLGDPASLLWWLLSLASEKKAVPVIR